MSDALPSLRFYFTPTAELIQELSGHGSLLAQLLQQIWECDIERRGRTDWAFPDYEAQAKVALLARVFEYDEDAPELFARLFHIPGASAIDLVDKWWTLQRIVADDFIDGHIAECGAASVLNLPMTGRPAVDYWLQQQQAAMRKK